jgi:transcriptional regulator with AAA-type ATPase domain
MVRVLRNENFTGADNFVSEFVAATDDDHFAIVIADVQRLPDEVLETLAGVLQSCAGRGWIAATMNSANHSPLVEMLLLPFFTHTVTVPALRHRIEDLRRWSCSWREITRGADVQPAAEAMRQLGKLPWPGNVAQLRKCWSKRLPSSARVSFKRRNYPRVPIPGQTQADPNRGSGKRRDRTQPSRKRGHKIDAANALGMSRATIYRKVKDFGIA